MKKRRTNVTSTTVIILTGIICVAMITYLMKDAAMAGAVNEEIEEPSEVVKDTRVGFRIVKDDLQLFPVNQSSRSVSRLISGRVIPKNTTQLFAEVQGRILADGFMLKEGMTFKKGQRLLSLDASEFNYQLEAQRSAFLNVLTGIMPDLKSDYPESYPHWLDYVRNYKRGEALRELPRPLSDKERYFITANQVYSTYYNIKALEERLIKFDIRAPYSGSVTMALADEGSMVVPGQQLGTIINTQLYELEAAADLEVISALRKGDQMVFRSNDSPGEWVGTVLRINDMIDSKTQNVSVYFTLQGEDLKAGMYLEGYFKSESLTGVFAIPSHVLTRDEKVMVLENDAIVAKPVELIEFAQDSVLVKGLPDEALVITNKFNVPVEGMKISE